MLPAVSVILVRPRFPENIGMVARAMANMGVSDLILVQPERWDKEKAAPLATTQGVPLLEKARLEPSLESALSSFTLALGTTARSGGFRKTLLSPEKAALEARAATRSGGRAALVFGSEDRGLSNEETTLCTHLVTIPTALEASSLNLAQAVLIMLYECVRADRALPFTTAAPRSWARADGGEDSRRATLAEEQVLLQTLQDTLTEIDHLPADNSAWFMQPLRRFLRKSRLRRHEFDMIMGICRQVRNKRG